jgi:prepilin-type N-terminal cleavage/methylation domain-containing protein
MRGIDGMLFRKRARQSGLEAMRTTLVRCFLESGFRRMNPWTRAIDLDHSGAGDGSAPATIFHRNRRAFTLVEVIVALALVSLLAASLVGMMIFSGKLTRAAREQLTAGEILEAKVDALRSCSWNQLRQTNFIQPTFRITNGIPYWGTIGTTTLTGPETYISNVLQISISVNWNTDGRPRNLATTTFISRDGLSAR